jgi:hypothetical protein
MIAYGGHIENISNVSLTSALHIFRANSICFEDVRITQL